MNLTAALVLSAALAAQSYVPQRVFDTKAGAWTDFEAMSADLARADVVMVGEQHNDPNTHALEWALLEALARRRGDLVVSLEMFERDTQAGLDAYLVGRHDEAAFLRDSRPWKNYPNDYRPLVELARERRWPVIAANAPKELASKVAREGLEALKSLPLSEQAWLPADMQCPKDAYFDRFATSMSSHPSGDGPDAVAKQAAMVERYYHAQCLKDEVMGESIARAAEGPGEGPLVVHYNGAFHSDFGLGAAARATRRLPGSRVVVVTMLPVASLDGLAPAGEDLRRADYLVYTLSAKPPR
ncbi:MAG TPA: ChaN family lipoprotein [Vicinamibacterales bacterium]|nr:ChaN family lipoprotein [Vicinamibacterales bacterium]